MDENDSPLDKKSTISYDNFMLELNSNDASVNREDLARQFQLDVEHYTNDKGLFVVQGEKIIRKPYDVSFSTRKINEQITSFPIGFSKIFYAEGASSVAYTNPPESIPSGCWCTIDICGGVGPNGHSHICSYPNKLSLNLTLQGFIECIYSTDKKYRSRLRENDSNEIREAVDQFIFLVEEMSLETGAVATDDIYIRAAIRVHENSRFNFLFKIPTENNIDPKTIFTNIKYQTVRNIPKLKKGRINYFHGATIIQYFTIIGGIPKKSSIRVYDNGIMTIIPCMLDKHRLYKKMITQIYERINQAGIQLAPKNAFVSVANGSFRLISELINKGINLETLYKTFHPTDENGNPLPHNDFMSTHVYTSDEGGEKIRRFVQEGQNKYAYEIEEEVRGKLTMTFVKYEDNEPTSYKTTTQIFNTGIVQLVFTYRDKEVKEVEKKVVSSLEKGDMYDQIESQVETIGSYFEFIRKFLVTNIDKMYTNKLDIFSDKEASQKSDKIYNTLPGVLPHGKKVNMYAGYIVDFFDPDNEEWDDNYGWSVDDSERGIIVDVNKNKNKKNVYHIIKGEPRLEKILETPALSNFKIKTAKSAPIVKLENGEEVYLIENFVPGKTKHWVTSGDLEEYTLDYLRVHKQSVNNKTVYTKDTQVCDKTKDGIEIRPDPYSFYGKCPGGLDQYVGRIGERSRKDNKFYPTCQDITDKNRKNVENEIVDFILNGLSEDQLDEADIHPEVELYTHGGVKVNDRYAGTFKPGTTDAGNRVTFWDSSTGTYNEGVIVDYNKTHGLGGDLNHTVFIIQVDNGKDKKERFEVRGELFHEKHRENRNFQGLNNIFKDENERKEFLINCAKKLNLVKPDIQIKKADNIVQSNVLKKLGQLTGEDSKGSFVSIVNGIDPFIEKNIMNLIKQPYVAVIVPDDVVRCLLFIIDDNEQYLIDNYDKVRHVSINFNSDIQNTIIDGFISEKNDFYSFDLLYDNGTKINSNYLESDQFDESYGRLIKLQNIINSSTLTKGPSAIVLKKPLANYGKKTIFKNKLQPYIGPIEQSESLIQFVKQNRKPNNDILFIPQIGTSKYIIWKHHVPNNPIVVQILKETDKKDSWIVGLIEKTSDGINKPWKLLKIPIVLSKIKDANGRDVVFKKNDFIKLRLNIMPNGTINELKPYIDPIKVTKDDAKTFEETKIDINLITRSIKEEVFQNAEKWEFSKILKVFVADESSRLPLKEKIYKYASQLI
jgi:hypothetical protein